MENQETTSSSETTEVKEEQKFEIKVDKFKEAVLNKDKPDNLEYLNNVLKHLFDPNKPLPDYNYDADLFKCFFGGSSCDEIVTTIESIKSGKWCLKILNEEFAFRCITCSPDFPRSILCAECFRNADHKGHEVIFKRTGYNAFCDCGDSFSITEKGFCKSHTEGRSDIPVENDAIKCTEFILPHYIYRLLQNLREEEVVEKFDQSFHNNFDSDFYYSSIYTPLSTFISKFNDHLDTINKFAGTGDAFKRKIVKCLVDKDFYELKIAEEVCLADDGAEPKKYSFLRLDQKLIERTVDIKYPDELLTFNLVDPKFTTMLDELIFHWICLKTPDKLTEFLSTILLDKELIIPFSKSLLSAYILVDFLSAKYLQNCSYTSGNCNIAKLTSRLFGNREYSEKLSKESNLLETVTVAIYNLYKTPTVVNKSSENGDNEVVECNHALISTKSMLVPLEDIFRIVSKPANARILLANEKVFSVWINMLSYLGGMASYTRKFVEHEEYESELYKYSFELERLQSASVLFSILNSYNGSVKADVTKKALEKINSNLFKWLDGLPSKGGVRPNKNRLTFHIPLHRYYSGFIYKALHAHNLPLDDVLTKDQTKLLDVLAHPLQIQVALHEINTNLWVRNGESLNTMSEYFAGSQYCKSFMDPDLFLIQCVASQLEPDLFVRTVMERFHVFDICQDLLRAKPKPENELTFDENQSVAMANGALILLAQVIKREISLDLLDKASIKNEILQYLTLDNKLFSEIKDNLPATWDWKLSTKEIGELVNEVADFIAPDYSHTTTLKNAHYRLKGQQWEEAYDPLFYMFYRSAKDDCEITFERYAKYIKFKNLFTKTTKLWPPFRLISKNYSNGLLKDRLNILKSRTLHAVLFTLLYQRLNSNTIKDKLYINLVYLLELAVNAIENEQVISAANGATNNEKKYLETDMSDWYDSNNILDNLCETIPYIKVTREIKVEIPKEKEAAQSSEATTNEPVKPKEEQTEEKPAETTTNESTDEESESDKKKEEEKQYKTEIKEENIPIGESMLSVLLKLLHKSIEKEGENADDKLDEERPKVFKLRTEVSQSRIGDEYHFISNLLNKVANLSAKCKEKIAENLKLHDGGETASPPKENSDDSDEEMRKKRAKAQARQKKILDKLSKKQQQFAENVKHDKTLKRQVSQVSFDEAADEDPNAFDCCICRSSASPSFDRPIGLVCLATPSSAMGLFNSVDVKINLLEKAAEDAKKPKKEEKVQPPEGEQSTAEEGASTEEAKKDDDESETANDTTFYSKEKKRVDTLKELFTKDSCKESINIGHKGGICVITCGHYLHFDCFGEYSTENSDGKNFTCPLCRQSANFLMPVKNTLISKYKILRLNSTNVIKENTEETGHNSYEYIEQMLKADCIIDPKYLKKMMFCDNATVEGLCESVSSQYRYLDSSEHKLNVPFHLIGDGDGILFLSSVLRTQLMVNSLQRKNTKTSTVTRSCFIPLFDILSTRCKLLCTSAKPHLKAWNLVTKPKLDAKIDPSVKSEVPVLLRDPISMFLLVILNWPTQIHRETYQRLATTFFNLSFIQNVLVAVLQLTTEQRKNYVLKNKHELKTLNDYIAFIVQKLDNLPDDKKIVIENPTVLNDQAESYVKSLCLQYLRQTALLQCYLFNEEPENNDDFESLISYIQIQCANESQNGLLNWYDTNSVDILESWLQELISVNSTYHTEVQKLLTLEKSNYKLPQLIELPRLFTDLFGAFVETKCQSCSSRCTNSAICLLCGKFISNCCGNNCLSHTNECFINAGLFLYSLTGIIYIYSNSYNAKWGTLYLDEHGEADEEISRGEQMYLSEERYKILKRLWFNHTSRHQGLEWQTAWS